MFSLLKKFFKNTYSNHRLAALFVTHSFVVALLIIFMKIVIHLPYNFLLWDDGYYNIGKSFYNGNISLLHQYKTPGIPALLSVLNIFPTGLQPFIRLIITQFCTFLNIYFGLKIFSKFLQPKAVLFGMLIALFNPLYLWWACLRSSPEIYITTFVGLLIFLYLKFNEKPSAVLILLIIAAVQISILFKPVLIFIPLIVSFFYLISKKYKYAIIHSAIFLICFISFKFVMDISTPANDYPYGVTAFMGDPFLTESLIDSGKIGYYIGAGNIPVESSYNKGINKKVGDWIKNYYEINQNTNPFKICLDFIKENYKLMILSKILSPVYFISIGDTTEKSIFLLFINLIFLILSIKGIRKIDRKYKEEILLMIFIFLGYYLIYFMTQSCARYYIPICFYLTIFAGISIVNLISNKINFISK